MGRIDAQRIDEPVVQRTVHVEFERADGVGDVLDGVALAVREIIHRVDAPFVARAVVRGVLDPVQERVAHHHVGVRHVDLGAQHLLAVGVFAVAHLAEDPEVLLDAAAPVRALDARLVHGAAPLGDLLLGLVVHVGESPLDQVLGPLVELVEIVRRVAFLLPLEAQPLDVLLDGVHVLDILLDGVGVVVAEVGLAAVLEGEPEVDAQGLGVSEVQVAVGLRREAGQDGRHLAGLQVVLDDLLQEIEFLLVLFHMSRWLNRANLRIYS